MTYYDLNSTVNKDFFYWRLSTYFIGFQKFKFYNKQKFTFITLLMDYNVIGDGKIFSDTIKK